MSKQLKDREPSFYAIIPARVRYDKDLCPNAKLLYGEITALCSKEGYCWAANSYFAKLYNVHRNTISSWVSSLEKKHYVTTETIKKEEGYSRKIYITKDLITYIDNRPALRDFV